MRTDRDSEGNRPRAFAAFHRIGRDMLSLFRLTVPSDVRDALVVLQFAQLSQLVPVLYLTIGIISLASGIAAQGEFPLQFQYAFPACLILASAWRYAVWKRRTEHEVSAEQARLHLRGTFAIAMALSLIGGLWAVSAYYETHETRRVLAAIFMTMAAFAAANCLASLPRAAIGTIVAGLTPVLVAMLLTPDQGVQALAASIFVVSILQIRLVLSKFAEMTNNLVLQREMRSLADTDALTGLANRRAFTGLLEAEAEAIDTRETLAVAMLDLDGFKPANDRFGHAAGDAILIEVAERLRALWPDAHCIARVGGDEFAIIFTDHKDAARLEAVAGTIRRMLSLPYVISTDVISVSASVGLAKWPDGGASVSDLLKSADHALYADKAARSGRDLAAMG